MMRSSLPPFVTALCEKYSDHRLRFLADDTSPALLTAKIGRWRCQPLKLNIDLATQSGAVESSYDFEFFSNGVAECGTMWDESEDERSRIEMTFEDWVAGQVDDLVHRHLEWLKGEG